MSLSATTGLRQHAICPGCGAAERHRLQWLSLQSIQEHTELSRMRLLHFAPESFFRCRFPKMFKSYVTADLNPRGVDCAADLTKALPFPPGSFDMVYASHVLEHIREDEAALANIRRVLSSTGIAILPVPIVAETTVEYLQANPFEAGHVRAPGRDYYQRYTKYFSSVEVVSSDSFSERYQPFVYEDRSGWPTSNMPLRRAMPGIRHAETVPVCRV
jgi:SAM-dependent methyltransferase